MDTIGKYEILEEIGAGGFGVVYKARDPFIKRLVAVKTCSSDREEIRQRFFREAEIAGNLQHRNVTTVHDFGVHDEIPYLVQEFLTGEDLEEFIRSGQPLPDHTKVDFLLQIAEGLNYAHEQGVVHRDVKPGNIRILESGRVKIMDFGIAKLTHATSRLTKTGMTLGTSAYLAPEQIQDEEITKAVDIYAYGVVAYELLTGRRPFRGETVSSLFYQILHQEPTPVREISVHCPPELVSIVERCLQKDPRNRYWSFSEIIEEMRPIRDRLSGASDDSSSRPLRRHELGENAATTQMPSASISEEGGPGRKSRFRKMLWSAIAMVALVSLLGVLLHLSPGLVPGSDVRQAASTGIDEGREPRTVPVTPASGKETVDEGEKEKAQIASGDEAADTGEDSGPPVGRRAGELGSTEASEGEAPAAETPQTRSEGRELPSETTRSDPSPREASEAGPDLGAIDELVRSASVATEVEARRDRAADESRSTTPIHQGSSSRRQGRSGPSTGSEPTTTEPMFPDSRNPRDARDSRGEISRVIQRYVDGYEALDFQAVRAVFPSAPRRLALTFEGMRSLELSLTDCAIDREADRARARCRMSQVAELEGGSPRREEGTVELLLERRDGRWVIVERSSSGRGSGF